MKRLPSSDSLLPICHSDEIASLYSFPSDTMGPQDDEECLIAASSSEKKRRLSAEQVKALEKNFEVENKLEPERKAQLAHELGLQPRQVAVWFQNRRARWKAKNLEREYGDLKNSYDALRTECDALRKDKDGLLAQIKELKSKLSEGETDNMSFSSVKEELVHSESDDIIPPSVFEHHDTIPLLIFKDGSSDSDSSAVLNEKTDQKGLAFETCVHKGVFFGENQQNVLKMEDDVFLGGEVPCSSLFHEEQPPSLSWYYSTEQWN